MALRFRVDITYQRTKTFYVEAEDEATVDAFLEAHPDWQPHDVEGLVDSTGDEKDVEYTVAAEEKITARFRVTKDLDLEEVG